MKVFKKLLASGLIITSLLSVACSQNNIDKTEEALEDKVKTIIQANIEEYTDLEKNVGLNETQTKRLEYVKEMDLDKVNVEIEEKEQQYIVDITIPYIAEKGQIFTILVDKNEDIDISDLDLVRLEENNDMKLVSRVWYNKDSDTPYLLKVVEGYEDFTKERKGDYSVMTVKEEELIEDFYGMLGNMSVYNTFNWNNFLK